MSTIIGMGANVSNKKKEDKDLIKKIESLSLNIKELNKTIEDLTSKNEALEADKVNLTKTIEDLTKKASKQDKKTNPEETEQDKNKE